MRFQDFKKYFFQTKTPKQNLIAELKIAFQEFEDLTLIIRRIEKEMPAFRTLLWKVIQGSKLLPSDYSELGKVNFKQFQGALSQEMNWEALLFEREFANINEFIKLQKEFEVNLLLGNFSDARKTLEIIENEICKSLWCIEQRLILDEYEHNSHKNWETRNFLLSEENEMYTRVLSNMFSLKAEKKVSFFQYNDEFSSWVEKQGMRDNPIYQGAIEYFSFRANFFATNKSNLANIIVTESSFSLIDRYLNFIRVAQLVVVDSEHDKMFLKPVLQVLNKKIDDIRLKCLLFTFGESCQLEVDHFKNDVTDLIDQYTSGNYELSAEHAKELLLNKDSNKPELIEIFIKSKIECKNDSINITKSKSILNELSKSYYDVLSKNGNTVDSLIELLKFANVFSNSHLGIQIYSLVNHELGWDTPIDYSLLDALSSGIINPRLIALINTESRKVILDEFIAQNPTSLTTKTYNYFYSDSHLVEGEDLAEIPLIKSKLYRSRVFLKNGKYEEAINIYQPLYNDHRLSVINKYEVISSIFQCFLSTNDYRSNILIFVDSHLKNPYLTNKCDSNQLQSIIIKGKFKNVGSKNDLIELPIFFKQINSNKNRLKQAYEQFLNANGCKKPSEFLGRKNDFEKSKFVFFLRTICVPEILQLSKHVSSTQGVNEERILICQFLEVIDSVNALEYKSEIAEITKRNTISKVIGQIDQGKIYVNEDKIKRLFLATNATAEAAKLNFIDDRLITTPETFQRMIDLRSFESNHEFKDAFFLLGDSDGKFKIKGGVGFEVFKEMFLEIRDWFVMNNEYGYGLDAYLSTRIRHGTLPNHIRSVFETFHLVTSQTDGNYTFNEYWQNNLALPDSSMESLQSCLALFSSKVDSISLFLKDELVQYKTENRNIKKHALFNFSYEDFDLLFLYKEFSTVDSYEKFIDLAINMLWKKTESLLLSVQEKLNTDIKEQYVIQLEWLEKEITALAQRDVLYELLNGITSCKTEIQALLSNIAKWFKRADSSFDGQYQLDTLIDASIQIIKNTNSGYNFSIKKNCESNIHIKGENHQHFIDLINIFLQNMIQHSDLSVDKLKASIALRENENELTLEFSNKCSESVSSEELRTKMNRIKENWDSMDRNISYEKNSGFPKINKILRSDLGRQLCEFDFEIEDNQLKIQVLFDKYFM